MSDVIDPSWGCFASPVRIEHRVAFGDRSADGSFGFTYNYLDYVFLDERGDEVVMARAYLDAVRTASLKVSMDKLASSHMQDILCFLMLRFSKIVALAGAAGYVEVYEAFTAPAAARIATYLAHAEETA